MKKEKKEGIKQVIKALVEFLKIKLNADQGKLYIFTFKIKLFLFAAWY